jgi:hypothetical protein
MQALLGNGLPSLTLNKEELKVDTQLPVPKQKFSILPPKDAKETLLAAGAAFRSDRLNDIKAAQDRFQDEERERKLFIEKNWEAASNVQKQEFLNMLSNYRLPEYKALIDYIKAERAWWKSDYSKGLAQSSLESVYSDFKDDVSDKTKGYEQALGVNSIKNKELLEKRKADSFVGDADPDIVNWDNTDQPLPEEPKTEKDPFKRSVWDDVSDSWRIIAGSLGSLIWFIFGLRFASSIANEYYYKKAPYKILMFVYTFIFTPVLIPYFIFKTIRTWLLPESYPPFVYRCFLPLFESEDPKMASSWFTYILDEATIADKFSKIKGEEDAKRRVLKTTVLEDLQNELAKNVLLAALPPAPKGC